MATKRRREPDFIFNVEVITRPEADVNEMTTTFYQYFDELPSHLIYIDENGSRVYQFPVWGGIPSTQEIVGVLMKAMKANFNILAIEILPEDGR